MDMLWDGTLENGLPIYSVEQYRWGLSALIVSLMVGLVLSTIIKGKTKV
jgi:hypothetical protein